MNPNAFERATLKVDGLWPLDSRAVVAWLASTGTTLPLPESLNRSALDVYGPCRPLRAGDAELKELLIVHVGSHLVGALRACGATASLTIDDHYYAVPGGLAREAAHLLISLAHWQQRTRPAPIVKWEKPRSEA